MGGGNFVDRVVTAGERKAARYQDRNRRRAAIERAVRLPALIGAATLALLAWWLSGWETWPWLLGGFGGLAAVLVAARRVPPVWRATVPLLVVGVWLLTYVDPWWWVLLAGVAVTGAGVAALVMLRLRVRRWQTLGALAVGVVMVAAGWAMLAVDAARQARQTQQELNQAHDDAVARILPEPRRAWSTSWRNGSPARHRTRSPTRVSSSHPPPHGNSPTPGMCLTARPLFVRWPQRSRRRATT